MVSGFLTSPNDHARICSGDARPMRIASKLLTSMRFKGWDSARPTSPPLTQGRHAPRRHVGAPTVAAGSGHRRRFYHAAPLLSPGDLADIGRRASSRLDRRPFRTFLVHLALPP